MVAKRIVVTGRVQGVGYRAFVEDIASALGIAGEVWNRRDGAVELVAQHEMDEQLGRLIGRLERGPGRVDRVTAADEVVRTFDGFRIVPTR